MAFTKKLRFSIRTLLVVITLLALLAAWYNYKVESAKPDTTITADDVAWATGVKIWKIDLTEAGQFYGVRVIKLPNGDASKKKMLCRFGGYEIVDTTLFPLATISMQSSGKDVTGKILFGGAGTSFEAEDFFEGNFKAWGRSPPPLDGDVYWLFSDSQAIGFGAKPFDEDASVIGLELIRAPEKY